MHDKAELMLTYVGLVINLGIHKSLPHVMWLPSCLTLKLWWQYPCAVNMAVAELVRTELFSKTLFNSVLYRLFNDYTFLYEVDRLLFKYSSTAGLLGFFHISGYIHSTAMNMLCSVHLPFDDFSGDY